MFPAQRIALVTVEMSNFRMTHQSSKTICA